MPAGHTRQEVQMARELARELEVGELHVFWSAGAEAAPAPSPLPVVFRALSALGGALGRLAGGEPRSRRL